MGYFWLNSIKETELIWLNRSYYTAMDRGLWSISSKGFQLVCIRNQDKEIENTCWRTISKRSVQLELIIPYILPSGFYLSKFGPWILLIQGVVSGKASLFECLIACSKYVRLCRREHCVTELIHNICRYGLCDGVRFDVPWSQTFPENSLLWLLIILNVSSLSPPKV